MTIADKLVKIADNVQKVYDSGYHNGQTYGYPKGYNAGYAEGQKAEYDRFWDSYQNEGRNSNYAFAFAGVCWVDAVYNPKYDINATGSGTYLFNNNKNITNTKRNIKITGTASNVFSNCQNLITIPGLTVTSNVTFSAWFGGCSALETINFTSDSVIANNIDFSACVKLSTASLQNIINVLSKEKSATLTLPSKFNTDEYKQIIAKKPSGWTIMWN